MGNVLANHIDNVAATKSPSNASFPASADTFNANDDAYLVRLPELDEAIQSVAATIPEENRQLYSYHNSFSYFTRRYGFTVLGSVQPHDFSEPSAHEVAEIIYAFTGYGTGQPRSKRPNLHDR